MERADSFALPLEAPVEQWWARAQARSGPCPLGKAARWNRGSPRGGPTSGRLGELGSSETSAGVTRKGAFLLLQNESPSPETRLSLILLQNQC